MMIENLERRRLFDVTASQNLNGLVDVDGQNSDDDFVEIEAGGTTVTVTDHTPGSVNGPWTFNNVTQLVVNTYFGSDTVIFTNEQDYDFHSIIDTGLDVTDVWSGGSHTVVGDSHDEVYLFGGNSAHYASVYVHTGGGSDYVEAWHTQGLYEILLGKEGDDFKGYQFCEGMVVNGDGAYNVGGGNDGLDASGCSGSVVLNGFMGSDVLRGGGGDDILSGDNGYYGLDGFGNPNVSGATDYFYGGAGSDQINAVDDGTTDGILGGADDDVIYADRAWSDGSQSFTLIEDANEELGDIVHYSTYYVA